MNLLPLKTLFKTTSLIALFAFAHFTVHSQVDFEVLSGDAQICQGDSTLLSIDASVDSVIWSPTTDLSMPMALSTFVNPLASTTYFATLYSGDQTEVVRFQVDITSAPDLGNDLEVCENGGSLNYDLSTLPFPGDYQLANNGSFIIVETSPNVFAVAINNTAPGVYQLIATEPNCNQADTINVSVNAGVASVLDLQDMDAAVCQGTEVNFSVATTPGQTYEWSANGIVLSSTNALVDTPSATTTYIVAANGGSCMVPTTDSVTITVNNDPAISLPINVNGCENDILQLGNNIAQAGTTYSWEPIDNIIDPTVVNAELLVIEDGTYTLTANNGCEVIQIIEVTMIENDLDIPTDTLFVCKGSDVLISWNTNPMNDDVTWTTLDGAPLFNVPTPFEVSPDDVVTYIGTVENNGCTFSDTITIQVDSLPSNLEIAYSEYNMAPDPLCVGDTVQIETTPIYDNVLYPDLTFQWFSNESATPGQDEEYLTPDSLLQLIFIAEETKFYNRINTNGACIDTSSVEVLVTPILEIDVTPLSAVCPNTTLTLTGTGTDPMNGVVIDPNEIEWEWMVNSGTIEPAEGMGENTPTLTVASSPVTIMVTATYNGCPAMDQFDMNVFSTPALAFPETLICAGDTVMLNTNGFVGPNYMFTWFSTAGDLDMALINSPNPTVSPNVTTTYTVEVMNGTCDPVNDEVTISVFDDASLLTETIEVRGCVGDIVDFGLPTDFNGGPGAVYTWTSQSGGTSLMGSSIEGFTLTQDENFIITVTNDCAENQFIGEAEITADSRPDVTIVCDPEKDQYGEGEVITFTVDPNISEVNYTWESANGGNLSQSLLSSTVYTVVGDGSEADLQQETITVTAELNGCFNSDEKELNVAPADVQFPNIFTPGGTDDKVFKLIITGEAIVTDLVIYDRWGNKVYNNDNEEQEWDGTINGEPAPSEVYIYVVTYEIPGQDPVTESRDLTLLR